MILYLAVMAMAVPAHAENSRISVLVERAAAAGGAPPVFAVIAVHGGDSTTVLAGTQGRPGKATPLGPHGRLYVGSVTKSYVGLLAAELDRTGVLPLDAKVRDLWPELKLPEAAGGAITLRDLLSHSSGLHSKALVFRTANIGAVDAETFRRVAALDMEFTGPGFRYTNFGYLLYAQILERATGRNWQEWLEERVLAPLDLTETVTDPAGIPGGAMVFGHQLGPEGWTALEPKGKAVMHPAGGLYTSPADAEKWLRAQLNAKGLPTESFRTQRAVASSVSVSIPGRACSGYGLGLMICTIGDTDVYVHVGAYAGWRSVMSFAPALNAGVYVMAGSDHMGQMWAMTVESLIYDTLSGRAGIDRKAEQMLAEFEAEARDYLAGRTAERAGALARVAANPQPLGPEALAGLAGTYESGVLGTAIVASSGGGLRFTAGTYEAALTSAGPGVFIAMAGGVTFDEIRIDDGVLVWEGYSFRRVGPTQ